jgi:hypothetical protein
MGEEEKTCSGQNFAQPLVGVIWVIGWWFTIGFAKLVWWKAIIAVVFWAYYLGVALR